jgi:hypothetical protein
MSLSLEDITSLIENTQEHLEILQTYKASLCKTNMPISKDIDGSWIMSKHSDSDDSVQQLYDTMMKKRIINACVNLPIDLGNDPTRLVQFLQSHASIPSGSVRIYNNTNNALYVLIGNVFPPSFLKSFGLNVSASATGVGGGLTFERAFADAKVEVGAITMKSFKDFYQTTDSRVSIYCNNGFYTINTLIPLGKAVYIDEDDPMITEDILSHIFLGKNMTEQK